ncbi:MAG TPA: DNA cytosine methyltransferase [Opitutaceae bacterium]|nr:DNA cytosine methyltransferase [Opitutaceae bacterium]
MTCDRRKTGSGAAIARRSIAQTSGRLTCIDLFAGCGGLSVGLHEAGIRGLFAVEKNAAAFSSLKHNLIVNRQHFAWPEWLPQQNWDIRELLERYSPQLRTLRGQVDIVVGGPPCQGFSTAGRRQESDERNNLVHAYLELVALVQPKAVMFENVRGFTMQFKANAEKGIEYSRVVISRLRELGYPDAQGKVLDMASYGVPQRRLRFIVVATRSLQAAKVFEHLWDNRGTFARAKGIPIRNSVRTALSNLKKAKGVVDSPDTTGFTAGRWDKPKNGFQKYLQRGCGRSRSPDSHRFVNHTPDVEGVFRRLLAGATRNRCIAGEARNRFGLKKRSVTVLAGSSPAPTVTTIPDDFVHYCEPRVMTVRECARLQSFPDWFEFKGPYTTGGKLRKLQTPRYTQVGNAVPPLFAEQVGEAFYQVLNHGQAH